MQFTQQRRLSLVVKVIIILLSLSLEVFYSKSIVLAQEEEMKSCSVPSGGGASSVQAAVKAASEKVIRKLIEFGPQTGSPIMEVMNPFIFCVYHDDKYPKGNGKLGPAGRIPAASREFFSPGQPWKMYHGDDVPGFPAHPHLGDFQTITIVAKGVVDHADSLGSTGRYANGDVQWMSANRGIMHSEMFSLVNTEKDNEMHLFQIWMRNQKSVRHLPPSYKMLWREDIPQINSSVNGSSVRVIAGTYQEHVAPPPVPESWAVTGGEVRIYLIEIAAGGKFVLPPPGNRKAQSTIWLYNHEAPKHVSLNNGTEKLPKSHGAHVDIPDEGLTIENNHASLDAKLLFLEGIPIDEPIVQHGPFVVSNQQEVQEAFSLYRKTQFGGWPFKSSGPTHGNLEQGRFATYSDGTREDKGPL